jgi:hypothetical protein
MLPLAVDDAVRLYVLQDGPWWINHYFRLERSENDPLLIGVDGDSIADEIDGQALMPFPFEVVSGLCPSVQSDCGIQQRLALDVTVNAEQARLHDHAYSIVGGDPGVEIWVQEATRFDEVQCTDTPTDWYRLLVAYTGNE